MKATKTMEDVEDKMILRKGTIDITFKSIPDDLVIEEFTSFCEQKGYCPAFKIPYEIPSPNIKIYYDNKITSTPVSHESSNLIINRPEGILKFPDGRASIEIKVTYPFQIMNLLLNKYPENPSKRQILEITRGILGNKKTHDESIRGYFKELRRIVGPNILPPGARQFNSAVKIEEIIE